ncbi:hypothetical protein P0R31_36325 [Bradyrhizobium yuanmingense]|uniref:hypothetical protein n=1 Tax=Bradyrhizobium yuanmingense TaxID=108015 RepID=UPI0023B9BACE|nr:hypothetical protein [Bradyrhizobium yuanmingense]MDF0522708.1 hypothetical protein [Bradyrhizobium yuanmingense]
MTQRGRNEISALLGDQQQWNQAISTISVSRALEIIDAMMSTGSTPTFEALYNAQYEWALETRSRFDAVTTPGQISQLDLDRLAELVD